MTPAFRLVIGYDLARIYTEESPLRYATFGSDPPALESGLEDLDLRSGVSTTLNDLSWQISTISASSGEEEREKEKKIDAAL